jgi:fibro-slime domain-containing protein
MRKLNDPSKHSVPRSMRMKNSTLLVAAAPLLCGALGCGGSADASQVGDSAGSTFPPVSTGPNINPTTGGNAGSSSGTGGTGSVTTPGAYMLPAGFTPATLGGFKLGAAEDPSMTGVMGTSTGTSGTGCGTQILGVVRDFKGINEPMGHPDFEHFSGSGPSLGIVNADLGSDQKPVYSSTGAFVDPRNGPQTTTKANFDQWYRATPNVNKPYIIYFYFQPNAGVLTFQSTAFFPLDGAGWGNSCNEPDADSTGPRATCPKQVHNFGFTTEVHTQFNYKGGETFSFTGDDDLWVFINNKLAIDLGGLHPKASLSVSLDMAAAKLGIKVGNAYNLDLFHAERHTDQSNFRVDTNLEFTNCGTIIQEPPVK